MPLRLEGSEISLRQAGTDVLSVKDGFVGIGTTDSSEKLEVNGAIKATTFKGDWDGANLSTLLNSTIPNIVYQNSGNTFTSDQIFNNNIQVDGTVNSTSFSDGYINMSAAQINRDNGYVELQYNPDALGEGVRIFGLKSYATYWNSLTGDVKFGSKVGIGVADPSEKLEVAGGVKANKFLGDWDGANVSDVLFKGPDTENWNTTYQNGIYRKRGSLNNPFSTDATLLSLGIFGGKNYGLQLATDNDKRLKFRGFKKNNTFNPWYDVYHSGNFNKTVLDSKVSNITYKNVTNTFTSNQVFKEKIYWGNSGAQLNEDQGASIELRGTGVPYIDFTNDASTDFDMRLILRSDNFLQIYGGSVGIGNTESGGKHKLAVEGSIGAREIKVEASNWSDFVFEKDYDLPTLAEVEQHIREKGYLKDIPSATDVEKNGIFLGEMNAKLLQKIEELTLYTIEQEKELQKQKEQNNYLLSILEKFSKRIEFLENK
jgi:hypothetical protein